MVYQQDRQGQRNEKKKTKRKKRKKRKKGTATRQNWFRDVFETLFAKLKHEKSLHQVVFLQKLVEVVLHQAPKTFPPPLLNHLQHKLSPLAPTKQLSVVTPDGDLRIFFLFFFWRHFTFLNLSVQSPPQS